MADVRALLRQQRAARRIEHPHAAYSDAGKLLCTLCHEAIKSESLWEGHLRGPSHTAKLKTAPQAAPAGTNGSVTAEAAPSNKRKHDSDEDMAEDDDMAEAIRKKRSRTNIGTPARLSAGEADRDLKDVTLTPPSLTRRTSTTPVQGVEIQIPSRPATPAYKDGTSSNSTPLAHPVGPSPLIPREASPTLARGKAPVQQNGTAAQSGAAGQVDEDEWAAFEADIAATTVPISEDAVISAPAMTAEEHAAAAKREEEEREKRRLAADKDLEDEKEEATRALEEEFEDMEELEARVRRLKEKREALRHQGDAGTGAVTSAGKPSEAPGKENVETNAEDEEEDEDEDEDEDDFMGFRYRS
ncbi:zinc finger protein 830-like protein [Colletotrichum truncatum]|uniref:Zinc finger protein 830-like protein n=1 Tax=Colletotrichum truncatum TaxID=5467 RepID=A0ACC3ZFY8_COLTU|nr:zinc finger protein 830-like protein [Colletotrichum truncatum]KAF6801969.1 zinc finger protein 830-like protein [Colletotrichum truncatum]